MRISELVELIRAGIAEDERIALAVRADSFEAADYLWDTKYLIAKGAPGTPPRHTTEFSADLANHIVRHSPARVLAEVAAKRSLVDQVLGWEHTVAENGYYSCSQAGEACWDDLRQGYPCDCGRDERVLAVLEALATPYQEAT